MLPGSELCGGRRPRCELSYRISYGTKQVPFRRVYAAPLTGLTPIPESTFTGRSNIVFACEVDVEDFMPAYTVGDNSLVVATDSMKTIIIIRQAMVLSGATHEGSLASLARTSIERYEHLHDFDGFVSESIQHLIHQVGRRMLALPAARLGPVCGGEPHTRSVAPLGG